MITKILLLVLMLLIPSISQAQINRSRVDNSPLRRIAQERLRNQEQGWYAPVNPPIRLMLAQPPNLTPYYMVSPSPIILGIRDYFPGEYIRRSRTIYITTTHFPDGSSRTERVIIEE
jgi:hypothetical protein